MTMIVLPFEHPFHLSDDVLHYKCVLPWDHVVVKVHSESRLGVLPYISQSTH